AGGAVPIQQRLDVAEEIDRPRGRPDPGEQQGKGGRGKEPSHGHARRGGQGGGGGRLRVRGRGSCDATVAERRPGGSKRSAPLPRRLAIRASSRGEPRS